MINVCCTCKEEYKGSADGIRNGDISHGHCIPCYAGVREEIAKRQELIDAGIIKIQTHRREG